MYDALIFDLDGTLVDNVKIITKAWNEISKKYGWKLHVDEITIQNCMGKTPLEIGNILFPELEDKEVLNRIYICGKEEIDYVKEEIGKSYINKKQLQQLAINHKLFIVSNCMDGYIETYLNVYGFNNYFVEIVNSTTKKTKGENIAYLVKKYNLKNVAYIGDTIKDYEAAKQAKVDFIHAAYGYGIVNYPNKINNINELITKNIGK